MARGDLKKSVTVDLEGNLPHRSKAYEKALERMGKRGQQYLGGMARMSQIAGRGLDKLGNRYTGIISGATVALAVKQVGDLSERYTRLGINAGLSDEKVQQLKQSVFDMAQAPDIRVNPSELLSAIEDIVEKTGDLEFAQANIRNIGLAIQATGAAGTDVGAMLAEFQKQGITAPEEVLKTLDAFNEQGKEGAFTLKDLSRLGPRVVAAYNAAGRSGVRAMKEMGAALQVIRMGTGSSEQAATAFEAVLRTMADPKKIEKLRELGGIEVFDPEKLKEGKQQLKPINELMVEIIKAAGGKQTNLAQVFDAEALRAFNTVAAEYQRTGAVKSLQRFMQVIGDGTTTTRDSARAAREFNSALTSLGTSWNEFAINNLTEPVQDLALWLNSLDKDTVRLALNTAKWGAGLLGVAIAGRKIFRLYKGASALLGKKGAGTAGGAAGLLNSAKPIPVYVVNGPGGMPGGRRRGGVNYAPGSTLPGARGSVIGKVGRLAGAAGMVYGAWETGQFIGSMISDAIKGTKVENAIGSGIAHILAAFGNDQAQAVIRMREQHAANAAAATRNIATQQQASVTVKIESDVPVKTKEIKAQGLDLDVDAGQTMGAL